MSIVIIFALLVGTHSVSAVPSNYCSYFSNNTAAGASGWFSLSLNNGSAKYDFFLDLTDFHTECDLSEGLQYHIHSYWTNSSVSSSANDFCGKSFTGGHYDPNLACGKSSEDSNNLCANINRTSSQGYSYACNPWDFVDGDYGTCEVGDLSGKFGRIYPESYDSKIFTSNITQSDYLPPYRNSFESTMGVLKPWSSIVFHCNSNNKRLVCGQFLISNTSECVTIESSDSSSTPATPKWDFMAWDNYSKLIVAVIVVTFCSVCAGVAFWWYTAVSDDSTFGVIPMDQRENRDTKELLNSSPM
eukprot:gene8435-17394_t